RTRRAAARRADGYARRSRARFQPGCTDADWNLFVSAAVLWRIATDTASFEAHDLSGKGAEKTGGRWNRRGRPLVYTARSVALACLETVVHLNSADLPLNRFLVRIEVPESVWESRLTLGVAELPVGWSAIPEGKVSHTLSGTSMR